MAYDSEPLLSAYHYNFTHRPTRDKAWALAYCLLLLLTLGWALASLIQSPELLYVLSSPQYLDDPSHCPLQLDQPDGTAAIDQSGLTIRLTRLLASAHEAVRPTAHLAKGIYLNANAATASSSSSDGDDPLPRVLFDYGGLMLLLSLGAAALLAAVFVTALRHSPRSLVLLSCVLQVGAPMASAVVASKAGNSTLALLLLLAAAAIAVSLYCGRGALRLVARLLGLAAVALRDNGALLGLVAGLQTVLAGAVAALLAAVAVVGGAGAVVPNPLRVGNPHCVDPEGQPVTCCALAPAPTLAAYLPAAAISLVWTLLLLFEIKVYVVSGTVAQWYFSPAGHLAGGGGDGDVYYSYPDAAEGTASAAGGAGGGGYESGRAMWASLGHALGPSFGSLCAASGVLGATVHLRTLVNSIVGRRRESGSHLSCCCSCVACLCGCCCGPLLTVLQQLTKFGTVQMAMSGQDFWTSSKEAITLLRRNFMDAYNMWWYMPMVLHCGAAAFAAAWGYTAYGLARQCWAPFTGSAPLPAAAAATLGATAAATALLVLSFVASVLVNIADALFVCFVLDRDSASVTWHQLHTVLAELPCCEAARAAAEGQWAAGGGGSDVGYGTAPLLSPPSYYHIPQRAYGGAAAPYVQYGYGVAAAPQLVASTSGPQLGQPVGYVQPRPQYGTPYGNGGGFWGWLRSPSGSGLGASGMPVGGNWQRNDRPQYPPPAVLSPPYSDQRYPMLPPAAGAPPPQYFGSPTLPS